MILKGWSSSNYRQEEMGHVGAIICRDGSSFNFLALHFRTKSERRGSEEEAGGYVPNLQITFNLLFNSQSNHSISMTIIIVNFS